MTHFTYEVSPDSSELRQGDVLSKTPELMAVINLYHPHYASDDFTHFQILTQSCDLALRGDKCSSRYITLAAVRGLDFVIKRMIDEGMGPKKALEIGPTYLCSKKDKDRFEQSLQSLYNNNDKSYFFLKADKAKGLNDDSCTFLHLAITIRSEHYQKCLDAKIIELKSNFQAKLGWLVGSLYSRVGTEDFVPTHFSENKHFLDHIRNVANQHIMWMQPEYFSSARQILKKEPNLDETALVEKAVKQKEDKANEKLEQFANQVITATGITNDPDKRNRLINYLKSGSAKTFLDDSLKSS